METEINLRTVQLPVPEYPVPLNLEMFPMLLHLLRGQTTDFPSKLFQLEHYYLSPIYNAIYEGRATKPETVNMDGSLGIGLFQGFAHDFTPPQPMLAVSSGTFTRIEWEGSDLGPAFTIGQFQTAKFGSGILDPSSEKKMFPYLGFFDWKALMLEYYKQSFVFLKEQGRPHPPFLAVNLLRHAQKRQLWHAQSLHNRTLTTAELMDLDAELADQEAAWLNDNGFPFRGRCPVDCSFQDIRDIEPIENFQKILRIRT